MAAELTPEQVDAAAAAGASDWELSRILDLKSKAAEFQAAFNALLAAGPAVVGTELEAEHGALVERGARLRDQVQGALDAIDTALRWVRGTFGLEGARTLAGLGLVWFLPLAAITAAIAALGFWLADYAKFAKRFAEQQRIAAELESAGIDPVEANRQAAAAVSSAAPGLFTAFSGPVALIGLAVVGYLIARELRE